MKTGWVSKQPSPARVNRAALTFDLCVSELLPGKDFGHFGDVFVSSYEFNLWLDVAAVCSILACTIQGDLFGGANIARDIPNRIPDRGIRDTGPLRFRENWNLARVFSS